MLERFEGKKTNDICSICKKQLKEEQIILCCKYCSALFHEEHIKEWLQKKDSCPICKYPLKEKYQEKTSTLKELIIKHEDSLIIENERVKNKKGLIFEKILFSTWGFALLGLMGYMISLINYKLLWYEVLLLIGLFIPLTGSILTFFSLAFKMPKWKKMTLAKEEIVLEKIWKPKIIVIPKESITTLELELILKDNADKNSKTPFMSNIEFNLFTADKNFNLGRIHITEDETEGLEYYEEVNNFIKETYQIIPKLKITRKKKNKALNAILGLIVYVGLPLVSLILFYVFYTLNHKL